MLPIPHLIVLILLCLAFSITRLLGVVGLVYLFYLNPFICTPLLVFTVTLLMWEGLVQLFKPPVFLLPAPSLIWQSFSGQFGQLLSYGFNTFLEALGGFVLGCGAGLLAATVVARSPRLSDLLLPFAVASNAVPIVAMAPIMLTAVQILKALKTKGSEVGTRTLVKICQSVAA